MSITDEMIAMPRVLTEAQLCALASEWGYSTDEAAETYATLVEMFATPAVLMLRELTGDQIAALAAVPQEPSP